MVTNVGIERYQGQQEVRHQETLRSGRGAQCGEYETTRMYKSVGLEKVAAQAHTGNVARQLSR